MHNLHQHAAWMLARTVDAESRVSKPPYVVCSSQYAILARLIDLPYKAGFRVLNAP